MTTESKKTQQTYTTVETAELDELEEAVAKSNAHKAELTERVSKLAKLVSQGCNASVLFEDGSGPLGDPDIWRKVDWETVEFDVLGGEPLPGGCQVALTAMVHGEYVDDAQRKE